ncbi:Hypothetical predicted protein [Podarcis lilfordi]|uniref:Uncharacterized protein n=1 Tax=Podarcis lilfordi TaxID=74358 RepID=A0AA35QQ53_9SAUR|nr:Hypothetical predicted protein [Podarcis lilfordi]
MDAAAAPPGSGRRAGIGSLSEGDVTPDGRGEGEAAAPPERQSPAGPRRALPDATVAAREAGDSDRPEGPWHGIGEGGCSPLLRGNRVGRRACPAPWVYTDRGARLGRLRFPPEEPRRTPRLPPPWVYTGRGARLGRLRFNQKYRVRRRACPRRGSTLAGERGWVVCGSPEGPENPVARNLRAHAVLARREQMASRAPAPAPRQAGVSEAPGGQTRQARSDRGGFPVYPPESAALPGYLAHGARPLAGLLGAGPR